MPVQPQRLVQFKSALSRWLPISRVGLRRWVRGAVLCLAFLGFVWLVELLLLPWIVQRQVASALASLGFPDARFEVRSVTTDRAVIANIITGGPDEPIIDSAVVRFSPLTVVQGHLGEIDIAGAKVIYDPQLGLSNLGRRAPSNSSSSPNATPGFPFDRIVLRTSNLIIRNGKEQYWLPTSAILDNAGNGVLKADVITQVNGADVHVGGSLDLANQVTDATLDAPSINLDWFLGLAQSRLHFPLRGGGVASFHAKVHRDPAHQSVYFIFDPQDAWVDTAANHHAISADRTYLHLEADLNEKWQPTYLAGWAAVGRVIVDQQTVRDITLSAYPNASKDFTVKAALHAKLPPALASQIALKGINLSKLQDLLVSAEATMKFDSALTSTVPQPHFDPLKIEVSVAPSEISVQSPAAVLHDVSADFTITGRASADEIQLGFAPNGLLKMTAADVPGIVLKPAQPKQPLVVATLDKAGSITISPHDLSHLWKANIGLIAQVQPVDISTQANSANVKGLAGVLTVWTQADPTGFTASVSPGTSIRWTGVQGPDVAVSGGVVAFSGTARSVSGDPMMIDTEARLQKISATMPSAGIKVDGIQGYLPFRTHVATSRPSGPGQFSIDSMEIKTAKLPGLSGNITLADKKIAIDANWPVLKDATVKAQALLGWGKLGVVGSAKVSVPPFQIKDTATLESFWPALKGISVTGAFGLDASVTFDEGRLSSPLATVTAANVHVDGAQYDLSVDNLNAKVTIDSLLPLATPGDQQITVGSAKIGKLSLAKGQVHFRVENPHSIFVERTSWNWGDGTLRADAVRFDPTKSDLDFTLEGDDLSLTSILAAFLPDQATGQGTLYGRFPVKVRWPRIFFGKGFLYAAPGPGVLQVGKAVSQVGEMLDNSDPRFKTDDSFKQIKQRALDAMRDFQYDVLKMEWQNSPDGLVGVVHLEGKGRQGQNAQGLNLNLSITGLDKALTRYLIIQKSLKGEQ